MSQPEKKFKAGPISATVWSNLKDGTAFRTISLERSYKDNADHWQSTNSFRISDLPKVELVVRQAFEYTVQGNEEV